MLLDMLASLIESYTQYMMSNHGSSSERIGLLLKILSQPHLNKLFQKKVKNHFAPFLQAMLYKDLVLA